MSLTVSRSGSTYFITDERGIRFGPYLTRDDLLEDLQVLEEGLIDFGRFIRTLDSLCRARGLRLDRSSSGRYIIYSGEAPIVFIDRLGENSAVMVDYPNGVVVIFPPSEKSAERILKYLEVFSRYF